MKSDDREPTDIESARDSIIGLVGPNDAEEARVYLEVLLARIEELTSENTDLRTSLDAKGFIARWQEAENMGYQCGRSHAERDLFIAEKQAEAEKQRADEAEAALAKMNARHCLHCAMAYDDCPRAIELLNGGGPMDIECCSEWTPKEDEA